MKFNFVILIVVTTLITHSFGNLEPPESDQRDKFKQYERKSAKGLDDGDSQEDENDRITSEEDEKFIKIITEDLNIPSSGIKIVKAPDLSKDNEGKKISETIAKMLESQEKWIQKFEEELEENNKNELTEEPVEIEKTAEEIEGIILHN